MAVNVVIFWVVTLCSLGGGHQHFKGTYFLHLQGQPPVSSYDVNLEGQCDTKVTAINLRAFMTNRLNLLYSKIMKTDA
jgi:hypothetical protein